MASQLDASRPPHAYDKLPPYLLTLQECICVAVTVAVRRT